MMNSEIFSDLINKKISISHRGIEMSDRGTKSNYWISDKISSGEEYQFLVAKVLYEQKNELQNIAVMELNNANKILIFNGKIQSAKFDEFIINESLVHIPFIHHGLPKKILIIGIGDLGAVRETLKWNMVEHITVVEEDKSLLEVNIKFFNSFNREIIKNKKVNFVFSNCLEFIKQNNNLFDVVIINNTFSKGLKIFPFLKRSWKILEKNGYLIFKDDVSMLSSPEYYTNLLNLFNYRFSSIKIYQAWMLSLCKTCNYIMLSKDSVIKNKDNSEVEKILKLNLDKSLNFIDAKSYAYLMNPGKYVQDIQNKFNNINFVKTYKMDL